MGRRQHARSISGAIRQTVSQRGRARRISLARPGGLFHRAGAILLILAGTYLLLMLEQVPATAAQQGSPPIATRGSLTPPAMSPSATPTITATAIVTPTGTEMPWPASPAPATSTPTATPSAATPISPTATLDIQPAPTLQISPTWVATPTPLATPIAPTSTPVAPPPTPMLISPPIRLQAFDPLPTPTASLPQPTDSPTAGDPHVDYVVTTGSCAGCHRVHTSAGMALRGGWPEEALCFACHTSTGPGTDVQFAFTAYTNTDTGFFKHDVAATSGLHHPGETEGTDFGEANRHVECEDCHEPHEATRGPAVAPLIQREMNLTSGVDPVWLAEGAPAGYLWLPQAEREYQVCFKCHSGHTTLPQFAPDGLPKLSGTSTGQVPDSRDMAQEFNPYHASFHPVVSQGRNQSIPAESFVGGWSATSLVYCTDCHANPAAGSSGPHGSPRLHLLDGQSDYSTLYSPGSQVDPGEVCFKCHDYDAYVTGNNDATNFSEHEGHLNNRRGVTCYTCHDTHGSEQLHLINFDASTMTFLDGRDSQTAWYVDDTGQAGCYLVCHGRRHDPLTYTP